MILPQETYRSKIDNLLSDQATYELIDKDPTTRHTKRLVDLLKDLKANGVITQEQYRHLYPTTSEVPKFYGLPKVHKQETPLRPIVASRGSITYNVARLLADILSPLVGHSEHHIQNSADLVKKLSNITLLPEECLVSYDVTALFTSVPVKESLEIISRRLQDDETLAGRTSLNPEHIVKLLELCLTTTYFVSNCKYYQQIEGASMGSPISPIVANLFMEDFEAKALRSFQDPPRYWGRYVDDTLVVIRDDVVDSFTEHINTIHPAIKFTIEKMKDQQIPVLDTHIKVNDDRTLGFSVYRKPTHTDQYLQFDSHQPLEHKLGVIRTLTHRAKTICSTNDDLDKEITHVKKVLSVSGYTRWAWKLPTSKKTSTSTPTNATKSKGHVTVPYVRGVTELIARKMRQNGVTVHSKPINTIRGMLVAPKDKVKKMDKSGTIYQIKCAKCEATYIGETERPLRKRIKEHHRDASPVGAHMTAHKHTFFRGERLYPPPEVQVVSPRSTGSLIHSSAGTCS